MQMLPDQRSSRMTAVLLLAIAALLVYLVFFHWFVVRHVEYAEEIDGLREQLQRFQSVAAQRESMQARLARLRGSRQDEGLFLSGSEFDEAAAAMSGRIGDIVRDDADESCQIVSRQPVRPRVQERFQKVTVNVRMRCRAEDFLMVLYRMETSTPLMLVDDLNVIKPRARRSSRSPGNDGQALLDIRFNVAGYLK